MTTETLEKPQKIVKLTKAEAGASAWSIDKLVPGKGNPRTEFDKVTLDELSDSLIKHGMIQAILCRPSKKKGFLEIVAGERRWRAAKLAKMKTVPITVRELDDREAMEIAVLENLQREDLPAIDEARGFAALLNGGAFTQDDLAKRLGKTQGYISNRIRLLELPPAWQQKVISGEISSTAARMLVPFERFPAVLKLCEKKLKQRWDGAGDMPSTSDWEEVIGDSVHHTGKLMTGWEWDEKSGRSFKIFKPTKEQKSELDIVEIKNMYGSKGETEQIAMNIKLWRRLQNEEIKRQKSKSNKKDDTKSKGSNGKPTNLTKAQQKAEDLRLSNQHVLQREQFRRRLWDLKVDWLRFLCASHVSISHFTLFKILIWATSHSNHKFGHMIQKAIKAAGFNASSTQSDWNSLSNVPDKPSDFSNVAFQLVQSWLWNKDEPSNFMWGEVVIALVKDLEIDLEAAWKKEMCGKYLTTRYFALHSKDQLIALWKELDGRPIEDKITKSDLVEMLADPINAGKYKFPKDLAKIKRS